MNFEEEEFQKGLVGVAALYKPLNVEKHRHNIQNNDSVRAIFGKRYLARFSDMQTRHPEDIRTFGTRMSGYDDIDKQQRNSEITTWITIATMAHYLRIGVNVSIINRQDSKAIYEAVTDHIRAWRENYSFSLNQTLVPVEDLQALEDLSVKVFPAARGVMLREGRVKDYFDRAMDNFNLVSEQNLFTRNDFNKKHNIPDKKVGDGGNKVEIVRIDNGDYLASRLSAQIGSLNGL